MEITKNHLKVFRPEFLTYLRKVLKEQGWVGYKKAVKDRVEKAKAQGILLLLILFLVPSVDATTIKVTTTIKSKYATTIKKVDAGKGNSRNSLTTTDKPHQPVAGVSLGSPTTLGGGLTKTPRRHEQVDKVVRVESSQLDHEGLENRILELFGKDGLLALAIFRAESGLRCNAYSPTHDYGVAQINQVHLPKFQGRDPFDCEANLQVAKQIYDVQGFGPWSAFTNGAYLKFL